MLLRRYGPLALLLLLAWLAWNRQPRPVRPQAALPVEPSLPQHPLIRVYFNQSRASYYRDYRGLVRYGDDLEAHIIEELNRARISVDMAIHALNLPGIALALVDCRRRGVRVRLVTEHDYNNSFATVITAERLKPKLRGEYSQWRKLVDADSDGVVTLQELRSRDALWILDEAAIPRIDDTAGTSRGSGIMHHKFIVIDGARVVTGSANFTASDIHGDPDFPDTLGNVNHLFVIESADLAGAFAEEFALMWGDGPGGAPDSRFGRAKPPRAPRRFALGAGTITVAFGPGDGGDLRINRLIAYEIGRAHRSVEIALFVFSAPELAEALQRALSRGVRVRGVLDPGFAYRPYSAALDLWGIRHCAVPALPTTNDLGIALLPRQDKLHHKFALLDDQMILSGSHNWSVAADVRNDESLLAIENPKMARHFEREFARLYHRTLLGPPRHPPVVSPCPDPTTPQADNDL